MIGPGDHRNKIVRVPQGMLLDVFRGTAKITIPPQAKLEAVQYDFTTQSFWLLVNYPGWEQVKGAEETPFASIQNNTVYVREILVQP